MSQVNEADAPFLNANLTAPLKWHGGKQYLAKRIVALMPPHRNYVEPYAGGLAVLLEKDPNGVSEVANDLNGDLMTFWRVLASPGDFPNFQRVIEATPFAQPAWQDCNDRLGDRSAGSLVERAAWFFVSCRQSLAGRMDTFAPLSRRRTRRGMNEQVSAWLTAVEGLAAVHERLKRVVVLSRPALDVIRQQDDADTLFYLDPPYLHETRVSCDTYSHEMSESDHRELLEVLRQVQGKVMISGYPSDLYSSSLSGWTRHDFDLPNNAAAGATKRRVTEALWCNFQSATTE